MSYKEKLVLVVDDSTVMRKIIKSNLKQMGFVSDNIVDAEDGEAALKKIGEASVDLVISDWNMPKMKGIDFLRQLRSETGHKNLPFLMVTSEAQKEKIIEAVQAGVSQYIVKPFNANQFEEKIKQLFP